MPVENAEVILWGRVIGAVAWDRDRSIGSFEYVREFQGSGIQVAPVKMPLGPVIYSFPELARVSFQGLPGMLADSLPDKFGNLLIDEWLLRTGRDIVGFNPVERLCYIGTRGMGALEFSPVISPAHNRSTPVEVDSLVRLASEAIALKQKLVTGSGSGEYKNEHDAAAMRDILQVGTSAGGARAKAIIAWNEKTNEVRSGQIKAPEGFGYWLLKLDGVSANKDKELDDPKGYGKIEYAYYLMATAAGLAMSECRLFHEKHRSHFMTRRFDRQDDGGKIHVQSLCGIAHMDFNQSGAYSYEQALDVAQKLGLPRASMEQLFLRMVFNAMARNQDDHTKNIAFLMDKSGNWSLSPAFDIIYSYNPSGAWTGTHQMTINGKQDAFLRDDFYAVSTRFRLGRKKTIDGILEKVDAALGHWPAFAAKAGVPESVASGIAANHRRLRDLQ